MNNKIYPNWYKINNRWYHCITVYTEDGWKRYIDGKEQ